MKTQARAVVIGGGINGCSVLYHLTKLGWSDVVLVEKGELTSGSTWLAAGNVAQFNLGRTGARLHKYSIELYKNLEKETGQHTGWHTTGAIRLATNNDRMDEYRHVLAKDRQLGLEVGLVSPAEMKHLFPYLETGGLVGGLYHPNDGHTDPAGTTMALAAGARQNGAEIYRNNRVLDIQRTPAGEWLVKTEKGDITCQVVVNAAGLWADRVCAMVGVYLPIIAMEHHHLLFEDIPEIAALGQNEIVSVRDPDGPWYLRREMGSFLVGPYEADCRAWRPHAVPWDWGQQDLPTDLERISEYIMALCERIPILQTAGIRHLQNGPITYTPDSNQLLGPLYGVPNFYSMAGCNFGITQAGGVGMCLANWIVDGDPGMDLSTLDPRRFGQWTTKKYTLAKVHEAYRLQYQLSCPGTERQAGRPMRTGPAYDLQKQRGAVFGSRYGWERPGWFAPQGADKTERYSFRRSNSYFDHVGAECRAVRDNVAVYELSSFAKYMVGGPDAAALLDRLICGALPAVGKVGYNLALSEKGFIAEDMTIARLADDEFYVVTAAASELNLLQHMEHLAGWFDAVNIEKVTGQYGVLAVVGPNSRAVLQKLTDAPLDSGNFPYLTWRHIQAGSSRVMALRINFVGELGWELHHPLCNQRTLYQEIIEAGEEYGIADCGLRAVLESLRLEKGYLLGADMCGEESPLEAGLGWLVKQDKGDFIGREAVKAEMAKGPARRLVQLEVRAEDADAYGDEPVYLGDAIVGRVTTGGYGHRLGKSIAMAFISSELAQAGQELEVEIMDRRCPALVHLRPMYDPGNSKLRA